MQCFLSLFFPLQFDGEKNVTLVSLVHTHWHANVQYTHAHTQSLIHSYTHMSAHCLPPRNIRGRATAPVGAIYRSNTVEFQQISDPDLQLPLRPTGTSPNLFFTERMRDIVTL